MRNLDIFILILLHAILVGDIIQGLEIVNLREQITALSVEKR